MRFSLIDCFAVAVMLIVQCWRSSVHHGRKWNGKT